MKNLIASILFLSAFTAHAQKPLYTDVETGETVVGCFTSGENFKMVALRQTKNNAIEDVFPISERRVGVIGVYSGSRGSSSNPNLQVGITLSSFFLEGARYLPGNGEQWTYASPSRTVIAAKGNYQAFFLYRDIKTDEFKALYYAAIDKKTISMDCTDSQDEIDAVIDGINKYSPLY